MRSRIVYMLHITLLILLKGCVFRPAFGCANFVYFDQLSNGVIHKYLIRIICLLHFLYRRYLDRVPNFSYFTKGLFSLIMQIYSDKYYDIYDNNYQIRGYIGLYTIWQPCTLDQTCLSDLVKSLYSWELSYQ